MKIFLGGAIIFLLWSTLGIWQYAVHFAGTPSAAESGTQALKRAALHHSARGIYVFKGANLYLRAPGIVHYELDRPDIILTEEYRASLERVLGLAKAHPNEQVSVFSRFDPSWPAPDASRLAVLRGELLREILIDMGLDSDAILVFTEAVDLSPAGNDQALFTIRLGPQDDASSVDATGLQGAIRFSDALKAPDMLQTIAADHNHLSLVSVQIIAARDVRTRHLHSTSTLSPSDDDT